MLLILVIIDRKIFICWCNFVNSLILW